MGVVTPVPAVGGVLAGRPLHSRLPPQLRTARSLLTAHCVLYSGRSWCVGAALCALCSCEKAGRRAAAPVSCALQPRANLGDQTRTFGDIKSLHNKEVHCERFNLATLL